MKFFVYSVKTGLFHIAQNKNTFDIKTVTENLLSAKGDLKDHLPGYTERREQIDMAILTARAFINSEIALIQAGTGVGKSFAYLIPAILWSAETGETIVISTATTNLQDQLWQKDIPLLWEMFDFDFEAVVVKGAQQYICLDRLREREELLPISLNNSERAQLEDILEWAGKSASGERSDLPFEPSHRLWREVEVSTSLCLYDSCRYYEQCAFIRERKRIGRANLIITNHSMLMSDLILRTRSDGYASVLPDYSRIVIDEAHKFENAVTDALSVNVNPHNTRDILVKIHNPRGGDGFLTRVISYARHMPSGKGERISFSRAVAKCEETVSSALRTMDFFFERILPAAWGLAKPAANYTVKKSYDNNWIKTDEITEIRDNELANFTSILEGLATELYGFQLRFSKLEEDEDILRIKKEIQFYRSQIDNLIRGLSVLFAEDDDDVRWIEIPTSGDTISFRSSPLGIDDFLGPFFFEQMKTILFTSATLAPGRSFSFFAKSVGLDAFETHRQVTAIIDSPFPYAENALILVPTDIPDPTSVNFQRELNTIIPEAVRASKGRALILFTSHVMLRSAFEATAREIEDMGYECIAQGQHSRATALNLFREKTSSVLFGTSSFWDGIDVAGESLSLVIIVRLPFSVPNDPIVEARSDLLAREGENPFLDYQLPVAAMKLQQGLGRLIRSHTDRGVVFCLDKRLITRQYGAYIRESLPPGMFKKGSLGECLAMIEKFFPGE